MSYRDSHVNTNILNSFSIHSVSQRVGITSLKYVLRESEFGFAYILLNLDVLNALHTDLVYFYWVQKRKIRWYKVYNSFTNVLLFKVLLENRYDWSLSSVGSCMEHKIIFLLCFQVYNLLYYKEYNHGLIIII